MDLTELIDYYILPRLSPRAIRCTRVYVVCNAICHLLKK